MIAKNGKGLNTSFIEIFLITYYNWYNYYWLWRWLLFFILLQSILLRGDFGTCGTQQKLFSGQKTEVLTPWVTFLVCDPCSSNITWLSIACSIVVITNLSFHLNAMKDICICPETPKIFFMDLSMHFHLKRYRLFQKNVYLISIVFEALQIISKECVSIA